MPILKELQTPGGAAIGFHVAQRIEAQTLDSAQVVMVAVASWPTEQSYAAAAGKSPTWVDWHPASFAVAAASAEQGLAGAVEQALIADSAGQFNGGTITTLVGDLPGAKARRWANIKQQRDTLDAEPVPLRDFFIDADESSRMDLMGAVMAAQFSSQAARLWRCSDNVMRELSTADLIAVGQAIAARRQSLIEVSDQLYQQIQAAETVEEVDAVVWPH